MYFRLFNIPVYIQPTFWIFLIFFTNILQDPSLYSLIAGIVLIMSLLVHEYGHALTARLYGASPEITLEAFGGHASYNSYGMSHKQQFVITLNGPLLESTLILLSYSLLKLDLFTNPYINYFLVVTLKLNIFWCLLNIIPIAPLDGGHLVRSLLQQKFGHKGYKASLIIGLIVAAIAIPLLLILKFYFFAILILIFGYQNFQLLRTIPSFANEPPTSSLKKLAKSNDPETSTQATETLARTYLHQNKPDKAYKLLLNSNHNELTDGKCLLCKLAYDQQNFSLIGKYAREIYDIKPTFDIALLNSKAYAHLDHPALSAGWLNTAVQFEIQPLEEILKHKAYDTVRDHPDFQSRLEKTLA